MPIICEYKCDCCGFRLPPGWGYYFYVQNEKGERIDCKHPGERGYVWKVLGDVPLEHILEKTGFNSPCICLDCLHQFKADFGEQGYSPFEWRTSRPIARKLRQTDKKECPKCGSKNVKTELQMVGKACPNCKTGIIVEISTGAIS